MHLILVFLKGFEKDSITTKFLSQDNDMPIVPCFVFQHPQINRKTGICWKWNATYYEKHPCL